MNYKEFQEKQEELLSQITGAPFDWLSIDPHGRMIWEGEGFAITPEMALRIADWIYEVYGDPKEIERPVADVSGRFDAKFKRYDLVQRRDDGAIGRVLNVDPVDGYYMYYVTFEGKNWYYMAKELTLIADIDEKNGASR